MTAVLRYMYYWDIITLRFGWSLRNATVFLPTVFVFFVFVVIVLQNLKQKKNSEYSISAWGATGKVNVALYRGGGLCRAKKGLGSESAERPESRYHLMTWKMEQESPRNPHPIHTQ